MTSEALEIKNQIVSVENIVIAGHIKPDGDAVGSCLAIAMALAKNDKKVKVLLDKYPPNLNIIPGRELITDVIDDDFRIDLFLSLDCADIRRISDSHIRYFNRAEVTANVDHHKSNTRFAKLNYVDDKASSTCEVMFELMSYDFFVSEDIATALFAGMAYDTGGFMHESTTAKTYHIAEQLLLQGARFTDAIRELFHSHTIVQSKLLSKSIENAVFAEAGALAYTTINYSEFLQIGATPLDTEGVVDYLMSTDKVRLAIFLYEYPENYIKISFRSSGNIDVSEIAKSFSGGGHIHASGANYTGSIKEAVDAVITRVRSRYFG